MLPLAAAAQDGSGQAIPAAPPREALAVFAPRPDGRDHRLDYSVWTEALRAYVVSMGPPLRKMPPGGPAGRRKDGHNSLYRLDGAMVGFDVMNAEIIANIARYRRELEAVADTLDIQALPRNEQLAFWFNLHNVALVEKIAAEWPVYIPRDILVDGVPLDEARFITVRGIALSPRDIREQIVFRHWKNPKAIYGFWRGEIGGPELQRHAFAGENVSSLLDVAAADFVNSLRGTQMDGERLEVATLYAEVAPFYFRDFEGDLRRHLAAFAEEPTAQILANTRAVSATISEHGIADLHGGARPPNYQFVASAPGAMDDPLIGCSEDVGLAACDLIQAREMKLRNMDRRGQATARVFFSNIDLPGDPPNKNAVE